MKISQLAAAGCLDAVHPPLIPLLGEDNFIPVASAWLISPGGEGHSLQGDSDARPRRNARRQRAGGALRVREWASGARTKMSSCVSGVAARG